MDAPFRRSTFNQPLTYKALRRLALALGWSENKTQGKGSHRTFTRKGYREITLPCHSENHEYQRGQTRTFLKQILEPLEDVCHVPIQGIHTIEQIEAIVAELLAYLPTQVQRESEQAIAALKATLETYEAEQRAKVDQKLQRYEERRILDCEQTLRALKAEQIAFRSDWVGRFILQLALIAEEQEAQHQSTLEQFNADRVERQQQIHAMEQELLEMKQVQERQAETGVQLHQSLQDSRDRLNQFQKIRQRDRILIFGLLSVSVCLGVVLIHREITRSPFNSPRFCLLGPR